MFLGSCCQALAAHPGHQYHKIYYCRSLPVGSCNQRVRVNQVRVWTLDLRLAPAFPPGARLGLWCHGFLWKKARRLVQGHPLATDRESRVTGARQVHWCQGGIYFTGMTGVYWHSNASDFGSC
jgi:hypothetical protein